MDRDVTFGIDIGDLSPVSGQVRVDINRPTWERYESIAGRLPPTVVHLTRDDIRSSAAATWGRRVRPDDDAIERFFVAVMAWGSGTTNGRGPRYTNTALSSGNVPSVLRDAASALADGDIAAAYGLHRRLPGVGPSFFTKMLWAIGTTLDVRPTPLIMDRLVWAALGEIGWNSQVAAGSRRWGDRYVAYLRACEEWAGDHHTPEDVEYTLFLRGRDALRTA